MSPPHTTPPTQNPLKKQDAPQIPPKALKKQDDNVDEPNTDLKTTMWKFFSCLKNYKHNKPLEDLVVLGMTIKEFWQHGDKDYTEFEYGNLLVPKHVHIKLPFIMMKFDKWYYLACIYGWNFIEAKNPGDSFNTSDFDLHAELAKLHTIFCLKMLDITMMTAWCM
jgi:hypothetical protein